MYVYDIFLSYSSKDTHYAEDVELLLKHIGLNPFRDLSHPEMGIIPDNLKAKIDASQYFAIIITENTATSPWVDSESSYFLETRGNEKPLPIILLSFTTAVLAAYLPLSIKLNPRLLYQCDFAKSFLSGFCRLALLLKPNHAGILAYFPSQSLVPPPLWALLYRRVAQSIDLMGHAMRPTFQANRINTNIIPALEYRNVAMRVILMTPYVHRLQQLQEVQLGLRKATNLQGKIFDSINDIQRIRQLLPAQQCDNIAVRTTAKIMYSSVSFFDSLALITNYSSRDEVGDNSPSFLVANHVNDPAAQDLYSFYKEEFDRYWQEATHPEEGSRRSKFNPSTRILDHKNHVSLIDKWHRQETPDLPAPAMLIIYPTYQCTNPCPKPAHGNNLLCDNCIYADYIVKKGKINVEHIPFDVLSSILDQAIASGVSKFEFSGGGEPLEYRYLDQLLEKLSLLKNEHKNKDICFGMLTNGLHLTQNLSKRMLQIFSYIRVSFAEGIQDSKQNKVLFINNLRDLLNCALPDSIHPSIGLKTLLSRQNANSLVQKLQDIKDALGPITFRRINHIRVKSMRSFDKSKIEPSDEQIFDFRIEFFDKLFSKPDQWPEDVQVDLDLAYVKSNEFHCRLTPLFSVVDPCGSLLACYNYMEASQSLQIGDLNTQKFSDVWGSEKHRSVQDKIDAKTVCDAPNGCPCRFIHYQRLLDGSEEYDFLYKPESVKGFL